MMKRRMRKMATVLFATAVLNATLPASTNSQLQGCTIMQERTQSGWRVYFPPNKNFTVELPGEPHPTNNPDPGGVDERSFLEWFKCTRSVAFYVLRLRPSSPANAFVIGDFDVSGCKRKPQLFDEEVKGLVAILGGDNKQIISNSAVVVNGLPGHEFIYENGEVNGRVLIINASRRIYALLYESDVPRAASSPETTRMFSSFRPVRRTA